MVICSPQKVKKNPILGDLHRGHKSSSNFKLGK